MTTSAIAPRPPCAMCGVNEADECFTVCSPCWEIHYAKMREPSTEDKLRARIAALEEALRRCVDVMGKLSLAPEIDAAYRQGRAALGKETE